MKLLTGTNRKGQSRGLADWGAATDARKDNLSPETAYFRADLSDQGNRMGQVSQVLSRRSGCLRPQKLAKQNKAP